MEARFRRRGEVECGFVCDVELEEEADEVENIRALAGEAGADVRRDRPRVWVACFGGGGGGDVDDRSLEC